MISFYIIATLLDGLPSLYVSQYIKPTKNLSWLIVLCEAKINILKHYLGLLAYLIQVSDPCLLVYLYK